MFDLSDWIEPIVIVLVLFLLVSGAVVGLSYFFDPRACAAQTQDMQMESRWSFAGGCQIEVAPGQWIPLENYHYEEGK